jgi:hypothetical protein
MLASRMASICARPSGPFQRCPREVPSSASRATRPGYRAARQAPSIEPKEDPATSTGPATPSASSRASATAA